MSRKARKTDLQQWWPHIAVLVLVGATAALVFGYQHHVNTTAEPVTAGNPIATTTAFAPAAFQGVHLMGHSAIVYDLTTGQTLYAQNADQQLPLASLTKLLTIYTALQTLAPGQPITMSSSSLAADGDYGLQNGETFTFHDIARFALVGSSNDAAEAIAQEVALEKSQSERQALSAAALDAGLTKTYAVNGSGLDVDLTNSGGYGSARDIAMLAGDVLKKAPDLAEATTHSSVTVQSAQGMTHSLPNTNQGAVTVPGILLSKTGYTDLAGGNLVVVYDAGIDHPVAVVVLGSTVNGRFSDVNMLISATHRYFAGIGH